MWAALRKGYNPRQSEIRRSWYSVCKCLIITLFSASYLQCSLYPHLLLVHLNPKSFVGFCFFFNPVQKLNLKIGEGNLPGCATGNLTALRSFQPFFLFLAPPSVSFPEVTGEANSWTFRIFCNMKASVFPTVSKESGSLGLLSQYHSFICFPASRNLLFLPLSVCPCGYMPF